MTIREVIGRIDALKPNRYTQSEKVRWLSTLDGVIKKEIIDTHEGAEGIVFNGYNDDTNLDTELLVPAPYDIVYLHYLEMQMDYSNGEYGRYNNSTALYNSAYSTFERYYNRTHMPIGSKFKYF